MVRRLPPYALQLALQQPVCSFHSAIEWIDTQESSIMFGDY